MTDTKQVVKYIADANHMIDSDKLEVINDAINYATNYILSIIPLKRNIDIIVNSSIVQLKPDSNTGGYTYSSDTICLAVNTAGIDKDMLYSQVATTTCHELCHAIRWQYNNEWSDTLIKSMIFEGIASYIEIDFAKKKRFKLETFENEVIAISSNTPLVRKILDCSHNNKLSRNALFYDGSKELDIPRWAGYGAGYYLVQRYLHEHQTNLSELIVIRYDDIIDCI